MIELAEGIGWFAWGLGLATLGWLVSRRAGPRWRKENHRGRAIPVTLGWALAFAVAGIALVVVQQVDADGLRGSQAGELLAAAIVFLAGVIDDGFGGDVRGLRGHLQALLQGRVTTGGEVGRCCSRRGDHGGVDAPRAPVGEPPRPDHDGVARTSGTVDVAPGRAVKGFLGVAIVLLVVDVRASPPRLHRCRCRDPGAGPPRARDARRLGGPTCSGSSPARRSCDGSRRFGSSLPRSS